MSNRRTARPSLRARATRLVVLDPKSARPLYEQIYRSIRDDIVHRRLAPGDALPSSRAWAQALGVSRFTVVTAIERLVAEGYAVARAGSRVCVAAILPEEALRARARSTEQAPPPRGPAPVLSARGVALTRVVITGPRDDSEESRPFRPRRPPLDVFPFRSWTRLVREEWQSHRRRLLDYGDPAGFAPLREAIAAHVAETRGVVCSPRQVIVTSGSQQAFDLLFRLLLSPGDRVWMEEPGCLDTRGALVAAGASIVPVPVDAHGLDVGEGIRRAPRAVLAVVSPSHQYPMGVTLAPERRARLVEWARTRNAWIVEDDYDSYFRYSGRPMEALQGMDSAADAAAPRPSERVAYVGTFSKTMFPSLRLGYCIVPEAIVDAAANARAIADRNSPVLEQAALSSFMANGHYEGHLRRVREACRERPAALHRAFQQYLRGAGDLQTMTAGSHTILRLRDDRGRGREVGRHERVADLAAKEGLVLFPLSRYCLDTPARAGLVLGYGDITPARIQRAMAQLAACVERERSTRRARPAP